MFQCCKIGSLGVSHFCVRQGAGPSQAEVFVSEVTKWATKVELLDISKDHLFGTVDGLATPLSLQGDALVNARKARGWAKDVVKRAKAKVKLVRDHPILAKNQAVLDMQGEIVARLQSTHVMMENVERLMVVGHDRFRFIANGLGRWCKAHPDMCDRVIGTLSVTIGIYAGGVAFSAAAAAAAEAAAAAAAAQAAAAAAVASGSAAAAELTAAAAAAEAAATAAAGVLATVVIPVLIG